MRDRGRRSTVPSISRVFHVKMIQPAVGSPTTLPEFHRAIAFGEVLGVRQRVLVGDEHGRLLQRALAQRRARRRRRRAAERHVQVGLPRDHVERVGVDEAAVVVADVDDDAVARDVVGVEIDVELRQRSRRHVGHVDVAEAVVARLRHVGAPVGDPLPVAQPALGGRRDRADRRRRAPPSPAAVFAIRRTVRRLTLFSSSASRLTRGAGRLAVDRQQVLPALDARAERGRPERDDRRRSSARRTTSYVGAIEVEAEVADAAGRAAAPAGGALMPRCDALSSPIISDAIRRISSGVRAPGDVRLDRGARRGPVHAVELRIEEVVAQQAPGLVEHDRLLLREVHGHLRGHARPRASRGGRA